MHDFEKLAAVIAAHPDGQVVGRTRLQKTMKLLQRLGLGTNYKYSNYFYGPYSEELQSDISLLDELELISEEERENQEGVRYYIIRADKRWKNPSVEKFAPVIAKLNDTDAIVLELAATYDAFRELGANGKEALDKLTRKKAEKVNRPRLNCALKLLDELGLGT